MLESNIFGQISVKFLPKAALLWRLSFRIGGFAKYCLPPLPLANRISMKTLEKYLPSYTLTYSSKRRDLIRN